MVPVNGMEALERVYEALLRRREEKMALSPFKLVGVYNAVKVTQAPQNMLDHFHHSPPEPHTAQRHIR